MKPSSNFLIRRVGILVVLAVALTSACSHIGGAIPVPGAASIVLDGSQPVHVSDEMKSAVGKIAPDGVISTLEDAAQNARRDGIGSAARFVSENDLAVEAASPAHLADQLKSAIRKLTPAP
jgi:hypothetical protein